MSVNCYAQRLLNPFRGALHVVEYKSAEAVTMDGIHWDIYVRNDELLCGLESAGHVQISDIRYGSWSEANGLKRGAIFPSEDFKRMENYGAILFQHLLMKHTEIPFPYRDTYELWLLDNKLFPLVLIDSAVRPEDILLDQAVKWRAGNHCRNTFSTDFVESPPGTREKYHSSADLVEHCVAKIAGEHPIAQWFKRHADGSGEGLEGINLPEFARGIKMERENFPVFLLQKNHKDKRTQRLFDAYFAWLAPWLLLLPHLKNEQRIWCEKQACTHADNVEAQHRLYPEIIDDAFIKTARVEALMRRKQQPADKKEDVMSTFYIEMGPTSG